MDLVLVFYLDLWGQQVRKKAAVKKRSVSMTEAKRIQVKRKTEVLFGCPFGDLE